MAKSEVDQFIEVWEREAAKTLKLLSTLPRDKYDFRPDADGRSLGELAWHLAEGDAYGTFAIERGGLTADTRPPGIERPRKVEELASAYERVHRDAVKRVRNLKPEDLDRSYRVFGDQPTVVRDLLWDFVLLHNIHHRGQLAMMCRMAGGKPVGMYGPTREQLPLRREKSAAAS